MQTAAARAAVVAVAAAVAAAGAPARVPPPPQINDSPTIGILSVPLATPGSPCSTLIEGRSGYRAGAPASCFSAFYSRWLQAAGARPVLLPFDANATFLDALLDRVNGVLFTGGGLEDLAFDTPYMVAAAHVLGVVAAKNAAGVFFPLHGTCQGMQVLSLLAAQNQSVLVEGVYDAENLSLPLTLVAPGGPASRLVSSMPPDVRATLTAANSTLNLHHDGVPPAAYAENPAFSSFFTLVSTNVDRAGRPFISTLEGAALPVTATQWHPERNGNEFRAGMGIDHSAAAVAAMAWLGSYFVGDARRNAQAFDPVADAALLQTVSVFSYPFVGAPDAYYSGYQWIVAQL
jgi:gamma-glutamyl hydrolase